MFCHFYLQINYGKFTKDINRAVKNNPEKFPDGYIVSLDKKEWDSLMLKILTLNALVEGNTVKREKRKSVSPPYLIIVPYNSAGTTLAGWTIGQMNRTFDNKIVPSPIIPIKKVELGAPLFYLFRLCGLGVGVGGFAVGFAFVLLFVGEDVAEESADEEDRVEECPPVDQGHWESHVLREDEYNDCYDCKDRDKDYQE